MSKKKSIYQLKMEKMENESTNLKPEQSLQIIESMINRTKSNMHDSSFYFLLWGWVVLAGIAGQMILEIFTDFSKPYLAWLIIFPGIIATIVYSIRHSKKKKVSTHLDKINFMIWISFLVSYMIAIIFMKEFNYMIVPIIFLLAGNATFLTGCVIKFKPLILGGIVFWIGTVLTFVLPDNYSLYLNIIMIIFGYLVPGYLLKSQNKKDA